MTEARKFLVSLTSQDSNTVYDALVDLAKRGEVNENQNWEAGSSNWTFADGSQVFMQSNDVIARDPAETK